MTFKQLLMFSTICRLGSFSRAAEDLGVAQPALSRQIANLEAELGAMLLDRTVRPVALTDAGRLLLDRAGELLDQRDRLKKDVQSLVAAGGGRLEIGFVGSALFGRLPSMLRHLRQSRPDIRLELIEMSSIEQAKALKDGRIHVGFGRLPVDDARIEQRLVSSDRLAAAVPRSLALAQGQAEIALDSVVSEPLILYPRTPRPSYIDQVLAMMHRAGVNPPHVLEVADLHSALGLVAAGAGIAIVPESITGFQANDIAYRLFDDPGFTSPVIMNSRRGDRSWQLQVLLSIVEAKN